MPVVQWEIPNYVCSCTMDEASGSLVCGETKTLRMLIPPRTYVDLSVATLRLFGYIYMGIAPLGTAYAHPRLACMLNNIQNSVK